MCERCHPSNKPLLLDIITLFRVQRMPVLSWWFACYTHTATPITLHCIDAVTTTITLIPTCIIMHHYIQHMMNLQISIRDFRHAAMLHMLYTYIISYHCYLCMYLVSMVMVCGWMSWRVKRMCVTQISIDWSIGWCPSIHSFGLLVHWSILSHASIS